MALETVDRAVSPLISTCILAFTLFSLFAILGMQLFSGKFWSCTDPRLNTKAECTGISDEGIVRAWVNAEFNFDWYGSALLSCFVIASRDKWDRSNEDLQLVSLAAYAML